MPESQHIFTLIQEYGKVHNTDMFSTFNMGIGFCIVCKEKYLQQIIDICKEHSVESKRIGYIDSLSKTSSSIYITSKEIMGRGRKFNTNYSDREV